MFQKKVEQPLAICGVGSNNLAPWIGHRLGARRRLVAQAIMVDRGDGRCLARETNPEAAIICLAAQIFAAGETAKHGLAP